MSDFDPEVDALLQEVALRDSYYVMEKLLKALREWVYKELLKAETSDDRLKVQAYAIVIKKLETHIKSVKRKLKNDKPIVISAGG